MDLPEKLRANRRSSIPFLIHALGLGVERNSAPRTTMVAPIQSPDFERGADRFIRRRSTAKSASPRSLTSTRPPKDLEGRNSERKVPTGEGFRRR